MLTFRMLLKLPELRGGMVEENALGWIGMIDDG